MVEFGFLTQIDAVEQRIKSKSCRSTHTDVYTCLNTVSLGKSRVKMSQSGPSGSFIGLGSGTSPEQADSFLVLAVAPVRALTTELGILSH